MNLPSQTSSHGGLLFPLDVFRPTALAAALAEILVGKARNVVDATLELIRHPQSPLVLARLHGTVTAEDAGAFWAENPELAVYASQLLPRQCFLYYVCTKPELRQGFVIAQRGQPLAKEEATRDQLPPDATEADWPVARLCEQLRLTVEELRDGFVGGPRVELALLEPVGNDQELLQTLAGGLPEEMGEEDMPPEPGESALPPGAPSGARQGGAAGTAKASQIETETKRRESERQAERMERRAKAETMASGLRYTLDDVGIVVAPTAELADADLLQPYLVRRVDGDLPPGVSNDLRDGLQGKRVDFLVKVDFLSEVFLGSSPLNKSAFAEQANTTQVSGRALQTLEVLAPRLGAGTLVEVDGGRAFVSRATGLPLPAELILDLLS